MTITKPWRARAWIAATALAVTLALGAAAPAAAQEISPEQLALARKYVDLTDQGNVYETILVQTAAQTSKLLSQQNPEIADKIDATIGKILETYKGKKDELFNQFARVYATSFTQDELTQIVAFYETPAGTKLAKTSFQVNQDIGKVVRIYAYNFGTEFVTKVKTDLKGQGYNL
jgi:uncharacterized protein